MPMPTAPTTTNLKALARYKQEILGLLAEYHCLTTTQIWRKTARKRGKPRNRTHMELARLNRAGLISSFALEPQLGAASPYGWLLSSAGAKLIGVTYTNTYRRQPSPWRLALRELELELEEQVALAGWSLIRPQTYNPAQPRAERSPQYHQLAQALTVLEYQEKGIWPGDPYGYHSLAAPPHANDYVAYLPDHLAHTKVFILHPPRAAEKFWAARITQYRQLTKKLHVFGVFSEEEVALAHKPRLNAEGLKVTTLDRISRVLGGAGTQAGISISIHHGDG